MKPKKLLILNSVVRESIHRIDPYSLLKGGSANDEFDSEINSITSQLKQCQSGKDVSHVIARVLSSSFSENFSPKEFEKEGNIIYNSFKKT